jgi:hypothetical protein
MKLKWTDEEIKYFSKPVKKAEQCNEWAWWGIFGAMVIMEVMLILKILGRI